MPRRILSCLLLPLTACQLAPPAPPVAPRHPHRFRLHGELRVDPYHWLRERENPAVADYLRAENRYADRFARPTQAFQDALFKELSGRDAPTDTSVPYRMGDWLYYSRVESGEQYTRYLRRRWSPDRDVLDGLDGPDGSAGLGAPGENGEQVVLNVNELAAGRDYTAVGAMKVSRDGNVLAYSVDHTGNRNYSLRLRRLDDQSHYGESVSGVQDLAWSADNKTLFYVTTDAAKRPYRVYRHTLGTDPKQDALVFAEPDDRFFVQIWSDLSWNSVVIALDSLTTREAWLLDANKPRAAPRLVKRRRPGVEYLVTPRGRDLYIRTNDKGRNFRLVKASLDAPSRWRELIPHRPGVMLEDVNAFADFVVVTERENGQRRMRFLEVDAGLGAAHTLSVPEAVCELYEAMNVEYHAKTFRYTYQSMVTPSTLFEYDLEHRTSRQLKRQPVLGGYNPAHYRTERIFAKAKDGVRVPISLVARKDTPRDGTAPLHLIGYGAYGAPYPASFSSARLTFLDRGMVCAIAHVRGGGELGKTWHDQGRMGHKHNTFSDFIACAEHLITNKWTAADRLVAEGSSAGGLLLGAVLNQRPDLFKVAVLRMPFVDVVNTMLDATLPLTVGEFEEWGNPKIPEQYGWIRAYCPYSNLTRQAYPAMLVRTSFEDSQVMYFEPAKYVARLRTMKTNDTPVLLKTAMAGGHAGASGRHDAWRDLAFDYAFILDQLGIHE